MTHTIGLDRLRDHQPLLCRAHRRHRRRRSTAPAGWRFSPTPPSRRCARTASSSACASTGSTGCCSARPRAPTPISSSASPASACRWCRCCAASGAADADHVGADFRLGMTLAAEHLIRLGHRRIAFVGGGRQRLAGARPGARLSRDARRATACRSGPVVNCLPTREEGARAVERLMRGTRRRPDRDPLLQRRLRLRRAGRARRSRAHRRPRLRRHRLRQHPRGRALPAGADHHRDRRPPDRRGGRQPSAPPDQGRRTARRRASSCRRG